MSISCKISCKAREYRLLPDLSDVHKEDEIRQKVIDTPYVFITLKNDSVLIFYKRFGGLGYLTEVRYLMKKNLIKIDSIDLYGRPCPEEIKNVKLIYSPDSLINCVTNEKYYYQK